MLKFSHRGLDFKNNTIKSIKNALKTTDFDGVEIEVRLHNNKIVLYHDPIDENYQIKFTSLTYALHVINRYNKYVLLDIKGNSKSKKIAKILVDTLKYHSKSKIFISSFNLEYLEELNKLTDIPLGIITSNNLQIEHLPNYLNFISSDYTLLTKKLVKKYKNINLQVFAWTVNNKIAFKKCEKYKIDLIISDKIL